MQPVATVIATLGFALLGTGPSDAGATQNAIALCDALEAPDPRTRELALRNLSTVVQPLVVHWATEAAQRVDPNTPLVHDATCHLDPNHDGSVEVELNVPSAVSRWYRVVIPVQGGLARVETAEVVMAVPDPA